MSGDYSETSSTSWFSRLGQSIKSVLLGFVLFLVSFPLLAWNEYNSVTTAQALEEGGKSLVTVDAGKVDKDNEGKFVHLSGEATTKETLKDETFGTSAPQAIHLFRTVEMYQWKENKKEEKKKKLGGGEEKTTTYTYTQVWSEEPIDSSAFNANGKEAKEKESGKKVVNPPMPYKSETFTAKKVTLGAFTLPEALVAEMKTKDPLPVVSEGVKAPEGFKVYEGGLYQGAKPGTPAVGDIKVSFAVTKPAEVSVYGRQSQDTLEPYQTKAGKSLIALRAGKMSGAAMIEAAQAENVAMTWGLRVLGFVLMAAGIYLVFAPLATLADVIPFLGDMLGAGLVVFAVIIALPLTLVTIAASWIAVRPLVGVGLLVGSAVVLFGGIFLARKMRRKPAGGPTAG
jgi:hypothetical protein